MRDDEPRPIAGPHWYAIWTRSRHEKAVRDQLTERHVEVFLPTFHPCPLIKEGMIVEVKSGPLRGVVGRLVRKGAHARLVLSVDLIGQAVSVEVDAADVRPY
jgi:transcription antitermination factor NusG